MFFSAKCGSSISARFLIYGVHAVSFFPLVAILDPSQKFDLVNINKSNLREEIIEIEAEIMNRKR
jgi:hypothetical protein